MFIKYILNTAFLITILFTFLLENKIQAEQDLSTQLSKKLENIVQRISERQDHALDVSGAYETLPTSEVQLNIDINNQENINDIFILINRMNFLTKKEQELLLKLKKIHNLPDDLNIFNQPVSFILGAENFKLENVSNDFGKTSQFIVCSDKSKYTNQKQINDKIFEIFYCLTGNIKNKNKSLIRGQLFLIAPNINYSPNEHPRKPEFHRAVLNYIAKKINDDIE